jgi:hypothetical protein
MAGFEVILYGRFWVIAEAGEDQIHAFHRRYDPGSGQGTYRTERWETLRFLGHCCHCL